MHGSARADAALALACKQRQVLQRVPAGIELDGAPVPPPLYPGPLLHICTTTQVVVQSPTDCLGESQAQPMQARLLMRGTEVREG